MTDIPEPYTPEPRPAAKVGWPKGKPRGPRKVAEAPSPVVEAKPSPRIAETQRARRRRVSEPGTEGLKLHIPAEAKDPNFEYRIINDKPGRIHAKTVADDWDIVTVGQMNGHMDPTKTLGESSQVAFMVGSGETRDGQKAYLCRKPKDLYEEDKNREQDAIVKREQGILVGETGDPQGLNRSVSYVPGGKGAKNTIEHGR